MATINIGNLTFTHKGDYASGTAYVKNDVVYYSTNGNAYIAKQATTGNAPTNATYWNQFAQGSGCIWNAGLSIGSAGQAVKVNSAGNALEFGDISTEVVNTTMTAFQDAVNAGDRKRNPYHWSRYDTAVSVTDANNYFLWEVKGFTNHDNHPAASVEVQEDSGSFVNAYNKSTVTGTAIVQANGQSTWGSNDHLSRYPHMRFDTSVNTNTNYAQPSSTQGIYKPTGTPTTLNFRVLFWSENSTGNLMIGANPGGGSSHGCPPLSYLKITEIKA